MGDRIAKGRTARFLMAGTLALALPSAVSFAPAQTQAPSVESEDIVVIGRKIRKVRLNYALWGPHMKRCDVEISSGDEQIDRFVCTVLNACIKDGFRDAISAKTCLDERIASVAYRPPRWIPAEHEPAKNEPTGIAPSDPVAPSSPKPPEPSDADIVVTGGRPHVAPGLWRIDQSPTFSETPDPKFQPLPKRSYTVCIAHENRDTALETLLSAAIGPSDEGLCTMSTVRLKSGKVTGGKTCSYGFGSLSYDLHGKVNGETMDTALSIFAESRSLKTRYRRRITGTRIGDCPT